MGHYATFVGCRIDYASKWNNMDENITVWIVIGYEDKDPA